MRCSQSSSCLFAGGGHSSEGYPPPPPATHSAPSGSWSKPPPASSTTGHARAELSMGTLCFNTNAISSPLGLPPERKHLLHDSFAEREHARDGLQHSCVAPDANFQHSYLTHGIRVALPAGCEQRRRRRHPHHLRSSLRPQLGAPQGVERTPRVGDPRTSAASVTGFSLMATFRARAIPLFRPSSLPR